MERFLNYEIINGDQRKQTAKIATKLKKKKKMKIIVKGHIHTDISMKAVSKERIESAWKNKD